MQEKVLIGRDIGPIFNGLFMREIAENGSGEGEGANRQDVIVVKKEIVEES